MSCAQDLRELDHEIDAMLTGWPRPSYSLMTTETGKRAEAGVRKLRETRYRQWAEITCLRARLWRALAEVEGVRAANADLTEELEARRGP